MKYPHIQQHDERDCGAACLAMITKYYGSEYPIARFREMIRVDHQGASLYGIVAGAKEIGFDSDALEGNLEELFEAIDKGSVQFPFIARIVNEYLFEHFIVVYGCQKGQFIIGDPCKNHITKMLFQEFAEQWQEQIITFSPNDGFKKVNAVKGTVSRYFRIILTQKKFLAAIFCISVIVSAINISGVSLFQYVMNDAIAMSEGASSGYVQDGSEDEHEHDDEGNIYLGGEDDPAHYTVFMQFLESTEAKLGGLFVNLKTVCICLIGLYTLRMILQLIRGYLLSLTAKKVDISLTMAYFDHMVDLPLSFFGTRKTGDFMARFNDAGKIRDVISAAALTVMLDTVMAVFCGTALYFISPKLLGITLIVIIVYAFIMFIFKNPIRSINHLLMEDEARVTSYLKESIDGIETLKSHNYEETAQNKLHGLYHKLADRYVRASVIYTLQGVLITGAESIGIVFLLWEGAHLCMHGSISIVDLIIFYYMISYFLDPVRNLINLQPEIQTAIAAAERLNDIVDAEKEDDQKDKCPALDGNIRISGVSFRYGYGDLVLDDVSMEFKAGSTTAIVGETGSGKTTLARLLMAFDKAESGSITFSGKDIDQFSGRSIRERIAYISQDIFLFSDSVYNNLRMGSDALSDSEIEELCCKYGMDEFIRALPMGYATVLEENGSNLSSGQKQQLAIARALLRRPDVLIMDEATSNLDTITEKSIKSMIEKNHDNLTVIIIAHRLNTIRNCDYIYVMDKGKIAEEGTHEELMRHDDIYKKLVSSQAA